MTIPCLVWQGSQGVITTLVILPFFKYHFFSDESDSEVDSDDSDIMEVDKKRAASPELPELRKPTSNFFESTLGKMMSDMGMNLVQEAVQHDLLKQQQKKARKDKSAAVMHAIMVNLIIINVYI